MSKDDTPLEVRISPDRMKRFGSLDDAENWLESERKSYAWLTSPDSPSPLHNKASTVSNAVGKNYSQISKAIERAKQADGDKKSDVIQRVGNQFGLYYGQCKLLASETPEAKYIDKIRENDDLQDALLVYGYLTDILEDPTAREIRAAFDALLYRRGVSEVAEAERTALDQLYNDWTSKLDDLHATHESELGELLDESSEKLNEIRDGQTQLHDRLNNQKQEQQGEFEVMLSEAKAELEKLNEVYRDQIALSAPVEYWRKKASQHRTQAWIWGAATVVAAFAVGYFFIDQADQILLQDQTPNYAQLITLLTIATLGVWGLRLLVRLLFSQIHLRTDAQERSVMLQAFLALQREGHVDEKEKDSILNTLFRPTSTGVVKDDSAPPNVAEFISRFGSR